MKVIFYNQLKWILRIKSDKIYYNYYLAYHSTELKYDWSLQLLKIFIKSCISRPYSLKDNFYIILGK